MLDKVTIEIIKSKIMEHNSFELNEINKYHSYKIYLIISLSLINGNHLD